MSNSLEDNFIDEYYGGLLHTSKQAISSSSVERVYDGYGNPTPISMSKDAFKIGSVSYPLSAEFNDSTLIYNDGVAQFRKLIDAVYPVGAVYFSTVETSPASLFGGVWVRVSQGRFIAGIGTGSDGTSTRTLSGGNAGGVYTHTLTVAEMPSHTHTEDTPYDATQPNVEGVGAGIGPPLKNHSVWTIPKSGTTGATGNNQPHENTPPAFGLYVWPRTA